MMRLMCGRSGSWVGLEPIDITMEAANHGRNDDTPLQLNTLLTYPYSLASWEGVSTKQARVKPSGGGACYSKPRYGITVNGDMPRLFHCRSSQIWKTIHKNVEFGKGDEQWFNSIELILDKVQYEYNMMMGTGLCQG